MSVRFADVLAKLIDAIRVGVNEMVLAERWLCKQSNERASSHYFTGRARNV